MIFTLRVDLAIRPWEGGAHETAMLARLLAVAREEGWRLHGFVTLPVLRAVPQAVEALLADAHDVDWLSQGEDEEIAKREFLVRSQHKIEGSAGAPQSTLAWQIPEDEASIKKIRPHLHAESDPQWQNLRAEIAAKLAQGDKLRTWRERV